MKGTGLCLLDPGNVLGPRDDHMIRQTLGADPAVTVADGKATGATPGVVLRSGRDTFSVVP